MRACSSNLETWEPSHHSFVDTGKPRKTCVEVAGRRTFRILTSSQQSGNKLSHCSLLRNRWPKPNGVLEHCRDCSPFLGAFSSDRIPKVTKHEMNLRQKFSSWSNSCNSYQRISVNFISEFRENFEVTMYYFVGRDNVVGIANSYGLDGLGIEFRRGWDFPHLSRPTLGPNQPP
jgi:hypothetical protein